MVDRTDLAESVAGDEATAESPAAPRDAAGAKRPWLTGALVVQLVLLVIAVVYFVQSLDYRVRPLASSGPGLLPTIYGVGLVLVCLAGLVLHRREAPEPAEGELAHDVAELGAEAEEGASTWSGLGRPLMLTVVLAAFAAFAVEVGFIVALFVVFVLSAQILRPAKGLADLIKIVIAGLAVLGFSYLVFVEFLDIFLPLGFTGI